MFSNSLRDDLIVDAEKLKLMNLKDIASDRLRQQYLKATNTKTKKMCPYYVSGAICPDMLIHDYCQFFHDPAVKFHNFKSVQMINHGFIDRKMLDYILTYETKESS